MRPVVRYLSALLLVLAACETRRPATETPTAPAVRPATPATNAAPASAAAPDTADISQVRFTPYGGGHDTTLLIDGQPYRLLLRAETDSTKPLLAVSQGTVGAYFAADTSTFARTGLVRGYAGAQLIRLLDPTGRPVFSRRLRKQDFFGVADKDIVTVSQPERPRFVGYHAPTGTLAFSIDIGIPASDVSQQCVLVLGLPDGRVRHLVRSYGSSWTAPDCAPRLLPDGTVLTCQDLIRPDGRRISLLKPRSELVAALPLSDSTLLTAYHYGSYRARPDTSNTAVDTGVSAGFSDPEWVPDPGMRRAPTTFVIDRQGRVRQGFRYQGFYSIMGYVLPRRYVWQAHAYYLLDADRGLYLLDKLRPTAAPVLLPFGQMARFRKPQRPEEVRFVVATEVGTHIFYVDPARPTQLRYQRID